VFSYFLTFVDSNPHASLSAGDRADLEQLIRCIPGLVRAHLLSPARARDPYIDDGPAPLLTTQLYFENLQALEEAAGRHGLLQTLVTATPPGLAHAQVFQQAMWTRSFPVSEPIGTPPDPGHSCSFLVHYPGQPHDLNEWLGYYMSHHVPLMCRFPEIRAVEVYTRVDWVDALPWRREQHFQRNKIVFDSAAALERALHSPVREQMKADRASFPSFSGGNVHHALATQTIVGLPRG
jgi:uncharacterized protein (TIGR02118 family)